MVLYHFAGEGGGGVPGAESDGATNLDQKPDADAGGAADGGKSQESQKPEPKLSPEEKLAAREKAFADLETKYKDVTSKLGKQSEHIKTLKDFNERIKTKPKDLIASIAKQTGLKVQFDGDQKPDLAAIFASGNPEKQAKAVESLQGNDPRLDAVIERLSVLDEQALANQYKDWDDLGDERDALSLAVSVGKIKPSELTHLATRGLNLDKAIEAAKKEAVEEYIDSLQTKNRGGIPGSRGAHKASAQEGAQTLEGILKDLQ
jgi:hypothetical protein